MTSSGAPRDDGAGPEQEEIWDETADEAASASTRRAIPGTSVGAPRELTRNLTSTARTPGPAGLLYADVPNRILALIIDILVLSLVGFVLAWLFGGLVEESGAIDSAGGGLDLVAFGLVLVLQLAISLGYFGLSWTAFGVTPGMGLLGLRVGDEADGHKIGWRGASIRWVLLGVPALLASLAIYVPDAIGLILGALGVAWLSLLLYTMAQSPTKQGLHDRYAHTIVYRARRRPAP